MTGIPAAQILDDLEEALDQVPTDDLVGWLRGYVAAARSTPEPVKKAAGRKSS